MKKTITVISYYSNVNDSCQAEWVDDRINAFLDEEYFIVLYSSILSKKHKNSNIKHFRTPSLSPNSFEHEYREIQKRKIGYGNPTNFFIFFVTLASKSAAISCLSLSRTQYLFPSTLDVIQFSPVMSLSK